MKLFEKSYPHFSHIPQFIKQRIVMSTSWVLLKLKIRFHINPFTQTVPSIVTSQSAPSLTAPSKALLSQTVTSQSATSLPVTSLNSPDVEPKNL